MTTRPPRIYVVGPFRARTEYQRRQHIARAERLALDIAKLGAYYRCPHLHSAHFEGGGDDAYWLGLGLDILSECDAAALVPGWEAYLDPTHPMRSSGSIAEVEWCQVHHRAVLRDSVDLAYFVEEWRKDETQGRKPAFMLRGEVR